MHIMKRQMKNRLHVSVVVVVSTLLTLLLFTPLSKADFKSITRFSHFHSATRVSPILVKKVVVDSDDIFSEMSVINNNELGGMRGGFRIGGLNVNIGVMVRTYIDGRLALQSQLTLENNGSFENLITTSPQSSRISGATVISNNGNGPTLQEVTSTGVNLEGLEGSEGIVINNSNGFTAVLQQIGKDRFLSTIINQSSGRKIQHEVNIDVTLGNFKQIQRASNSSRLTHQFTHR